MRVRGKWMMCRKKFYMNHWKQHLGWRVSSVVSYLFYKHSDWCLILRTQATNSRQAAPKAPLIPELGRQIFEPHWPNSLAYLVSYQPVRYCVSRKGEGTGDTSLGTMLWCPHAYAHVHGEASNTYTQTHTHTCTCSCTHIHTHTTHMRTHICMHLHIHKFTHIDMKHRQLLIYPANARRYWFGFMKAMFSCLQGLMLFPVLQSSPSFHP